MPRSIRAECAYFKVEYWDDFCYIPSYHSLCIPYTVHIPYFSWHITEFYKDIRQVHT